MTNFRHSILSLVFQQLFYLFILFSFYLLLVVVNVRYVQCFKSDNLGLSGSVSGHSVVTAMSCYSEAEHSELET